jgi:hypothetical protein
MDYPNRSYLIEIHNGSVSSGMNYTVPWELRRGYLCHFILRRMDKPKELIKLSKPLSEPSSIMTKMPGIVYYLGQNSHETILLPRLHNSPHYTQITGIIRKPFRLLPRNPRTQLPRHMHTGLKPPMAELCRLWKKPKIT